MTTATEAGVHWFVGVFRASAGIRLQADDEYCYGLDDPLGNFRVKVRTRYFAFDGKPEVIPRELWVEVCGPDVSLDAFIPAAHDKANTVVSVLTFALNAATEGLQVDLAFDACSHHDEHEFFQNFWPDEGGLPRMARELDVTAFSGLMAALMPHRDRDRLMRAIAQYEVALRSWHPGGELLVLAHLYMAMEVLTPLARRQQVETYGSLESLAHAWSVKPRSCAACGHEYGLAAEVDAEVRRRILFQAEGELYREAKRASDGLEHGFLAASEARESAVIHRQRLSVLVRHAIFDLLAAEPGVNSVFLTEARDVPVGAYNAQRYWRTTLVGRADHLAKNGEHYPRFSTVQESIGSVSTNDDGLLEITPTYTIQAELGEGVTTRGGSWELWMQGPPNVSADQSTEKA